MAGDWIKVEHATRRKPEILRAAEMLGISRREALGLFMEFWFWLDENLSEKCPEIVRNVSRKSLDEVLTCQGFSGVLESVGWGKFDDKEWTLHITNAERHNGKTAKTRALDAKRKSAKRLENVREMSAENRTREEKRRVVDQNLLPIATQPTKPLSVKRNPKTQMPSNFAISEGVEKWAAERRIGNLPAHLEAFKLSCETHGYAYSNWDSAFKRAVRDDWAKLKGTAPRPMTALPDLPRKEGEIPEAARLVIAKMTNRH
jgi:hypothetical protein